MTFQPLLEKLTALYMEREWDQYHSPKNLVMNIATEVGELVEPFRWLTEEQSLSLDEKTRQAVADEVGDVLNSLLYLCHKLGIDPLAACEAKLLKIAKKYPVHKCRGKNLKYTEYTE